jgi:hypothetical protein
MLENVPQSTLDWWYRWLTILAIGLPILGAIIGGVAGFAAFIVSNRIGELQAAALRYAEDAAREARAFAAPRHLSQEQATAMKTVALQVCLQIGRLAVTAANGNQEAQAFALDFVRVFKDAGCAADLQLPIPGLTPDIQGVRLGVRSLEHIPPQVGLLGTVLQAGGTQYQINPLTPDFFPNEPFVLIIGAKSN